ncbi:hypothetical protein CCANI_01185 [Corynebacterium canis]|uniref:hypothetical protein n=1 Tax=Corynebacterium canis TaxID=679663 RepID=UPI001FEC17FC|nr:hypothetical protein [Corynebacterium canis]WJY74099.1 hypothetical protein CCANI_01185 [Corynebacterium canis]
MTTLPNDTSPVMDDEEMMRLFKKFHIVTAGTRALEIIGDPNYDTYSFRDVLVEMLRAQEEGYIQRTSHKRLKAAGLPDPGATMQALMNNPPGEITPQRLARIKDTEWIAGPSPLKPRHHRPHRKREKLPHPSIGSQCMHAAAEREVLAPSRACLKTR